MGYYGGGNWIVDSSTDLYASYDGLSGAPLDSFDYDSGASSGFDVVIQPGESFLEGAYVARDVLTTVTLASQTSGQNVYLFWDPDATNKAIIDRLNNSNNDLPRMLLWEFDTDGSTVTSATSHRDVGRQIDVRNEGSVANADQAGNADNLDSKDSTQFLRSDVKDIHEEPVEFGARSSLYGTLGAGAGELFRAGGVTSDTLFQIQGGFGRVAWSWNARYDRPTGDWQYIVSNEPAMVVMLREGQVRFLTASSGTADDPIAFDKARVENGSIDDADDADTVDGKDASAFVLDQSPIEGLAIGSDANRSDGFFSVLSAGKSTEFASYQTKADVPNIPTGAVVYITEEQQFYFENGE
jgi:hypothetical protein